VLEVLLILNFHLLISDVLPPKVILSKYKNRFNPPAHSFRIICIAVEKVLQTYFNFGLKLKYFILCYGVDMVCPPRVPILSLGPQFRSIVGVVQSSERALGHQRHCPGKGSRQFS
jgi:hypothetical protein